MLKKDRVDVISVSEPVIDGPFGSLIERIIEWMDEYYSIRLSGEVLRGMGVNISEMLACGGGGSSPLWRQMLADTFNCPVKTVVSKEGPALGVAILAGVGTGIYKSVEEGCKAVIKLNPAQNPIAENVPQYEKYYEMYTKIYPALKNAYKDLAKL
jgi:xylulokinase